VTEEIDWWEKTEREDRETDAYKGIDNGV